MENNSCKKELIIDAALDLFARKGYDGVGMDEIAESIGMKGPAIYYYFKCKDSLLREIINTRGYAYKNLFIDENEQKAYPSTFDEFARLEMENIIFSIKSTSLVNLRCLVLKEHNRNSIISDFVTEHTFTSVVEKTRAVFSHLIEIGDLKNYDPYIMAVEFSTTVSLLVQIADRSEDKEEIVELIKKHFAHFAEVYKAGESE